MTLVANLLLGVAALITVLVAVLVADARHAAGADAMGLVVLPMLLVPRWVAVAVALGIAARRSALPWVHRSRAVQGAVALVWLALVGAASFASLLMAYGPHSAAFKPWAFALSVVVPAVVIAGTAICVNRQAGPAGSPASWRAAAGIVSLVVAWGGVAMGRVELADRREGRAAQAAAEATQARWLAEQRSKLAALSPQAPLRDWLPWLNVSIDELREPALAAVRARPSLERDLAGMLRSEEAPEALRFMWLWMPDPPASLAAPVRDAIAALPAWAERRLSLPPAPAAVTAGEPAPGEFPPRDPADLWQMSQAAIVIADKYEDAGLDFVTPIQAFAEVLRRHALPEDQLGSDLTYQPRGFLDTWLKGKTTPASAPSP